MVAPRSGGFAAQPGNNNLFLKEEAMTSDVIDELSGATPGAKLAELRAQRPQIVQYAQGSYEALLEPKDGNSLSQLERELIALRVALLGGEQRLAAWHKERLQRLAVDEATLSAVEHFPAGNVFSARETALLTHIDRVVTAPAASTKEQLAELAAAGFSPRDIVTIGQLIGFVSFQLRALVGLRLVTEEV
jgi:CMD domain protein